MKNNTIFIFNCECGFKNTFSGWKICHQRSNPSEVIYALEIYWLILLQRNTGLHKLIQKGT